ncbi:MAG: HEAT repeat domain-containing protein [Armatimonadota bacterium]|jgi:hypothetical protein
MKTGVQVGPFLVVAVSLLIAAAGASAQDEPRLSLTISLHHPVPLAEAPERLPRAGPASTVFEQGRPIVAAFTIANDGGQDYSYMDRDYDRSGRMDEYAVEVTDQGGRRLDDPWVLWGGGRMGGGLSTTGTIGPGEPFTKRIYLNQWVTPLQPGRYAVTGVYRGQFFRPPERPVARSAPVEIEVRAGTDAAMRVYLARLGDELQSDDDARRVRAVRCLGFTGSPEALPLIAAGLHDDGRNVAFRADEAFRYMTDTEACVQVLLDSLHARGPAPGLQRLLHHYGVPSVDTLAPTVKGLSDPDPKRRAAAAASLQRYQDMGDAALDPLLKALEDEDPKVRARVAATLSNYRVPKVAEALLAASDDPDEDVRGMIVDVLGTIKAEAAIPRLRELMQDVPSVGKAAVRGLENIGTPDALAALRAGLAVADNELRARAAIALLQFGDDTVREVIALALLAAQLDRRPSVGNICHWLGNAVEKRRIPGPGPDGRAHTGDPDAWIAWLRQTP